LFRSRGSPISEIRHTKSIRRTQFECRRSKPGGQMKKLLACVLGVAFLALGCTEQAGAAQTKQISPAVIAEQIAAGVGSVQASASGRRGVVFVFEEFHTSRVGRLETGV